MDECLLGPPTRITVDLVVYFCRRRSRISGNSSRNQTRTSENLAHFYRRKKPPCFIRLIEGNVFSVLLALLTDACILACYLCWHRLSIDACQKSIVVCSLRPFFSSFFPNPCVSARVAFCQCYLFPFGVIDTTLVAFIDRNAADIHRVEQEVVGVLHAAADNIARARVSQPKRVDCKNINRLDICFLTIISGIILKF